MNWKHVVPLILIAPALAFAQGKGPTDPQIAGIVVAANQIDIDAGKIAKSKSKNKEVKAFAQQMITDHSAVNKQAGALAKKLGVTPEDSDTSKSLKQGATENVANLKKLKNGAFDKAYVEHEVVYHQQVLGALDEKLIPGARNPELKSLLVTVREVVAAHFGHAKELLDATSR